MATLFLRRVGNVLIPLDDGGSEVSMSKTWKDGEVVRCDVKKPRNIGLHRKCFILLKIVYDAVDYPSMEALRNAMTVGAGYVETVINPMNGEVALMPRSWAFDKMDDLEMRGLYNALIGVALRLVEGSTEDGWLMAVEEIAKL